MMIQFNINLEFSLYQQDHIVPSTLPIHIKYIIGFCQSSKISAC